MPRRLAAMLLIASILPASTRAEMQQPPPQMILAHPERFDPFAYPELVQWLWSTGRRQQAAFWFYVFQARTRPWADADRQGDGAAALRASLNDGLGSTVNAWIASDPVAWRAIVERALSYEARLPLTDERPPGLTRQGWQAQVAAARASYAAAARQTFATLDPVTLAAGRRAHGLPVGPLLDPGPPLPDAWR